MDKKSLFENWLRGGPGLRYHLENNQELIHLMKKGAKLQSSYDFPNGARTMNIIDADDLSTLETDMPPTLALRYPEDPQNVVIYELEGNTYKRRVKTRLSIIEQGAK